MTLIGIKKSSSADIFPRVAVGVVGINLWFLLLSRFSAGCSGLLHIVASYLKVVLSAYGIAICVRV